MTSEEFQKQIDIRREMEFTYKGTKYNLYYDKDSSGKVWIYFGELFSEQKFETIGELLNNAKVGNINFKNFIEEL